MGRHNSSNEDQSGPRKRLEELQQRVDEQTAALANAYRRRAEEAEAELNAQRRLTLRADRLRSLGQIAAGIAHELNQPLVGVRGLAEHILIGLNRGWSLSDEKLREKLSLIIGQADRMTHIIQRVRTFARDAGQPETQPVQVNDAVQSAVSMLGPQLRSRGIALDCELTEVIPLVQVNAISLEEVVLNLLVNAADALTETIGERADATALRILVCTRTNRDDDQERVEIQVIDQGVGIPEELLINVFDPFLTTKGPDRGTGLGLAICKNLIEQVGGTISIESAVGQGTTVTVSLPVAEDEGENI